MSTNSAQKVTAEHLRRDAFLYGCRHIRPFASPWATGRAILFTRMAMRSFVP